MSIRLALITTINEDDSGDDIDGEVKCQEPLV